MDVIEGQYFDHAEAERIAPFLTLPFEAGTSAVLIGPNNERLPLPTPVYRALLDAVEILSRGDAIVIGSVHQKLTTTQAADMLGVSRQYLTRLIDRNDLPHEMVGRHRRLRLGDVLAYKNHRAGLRRSALAQLTALDVELGAYD